MSHDLLLAQRMSKTPGKNSSANSRALRKILLSEYNNYNKIVDESSPSVQFGTEEVTEQTYMDTGMIKNVIDMHLALKELIQTESYFAQKNKDYYIGKTQYRWAQIGELNVWFDDTRPMEYISTISTKPSEFFK